MSNNTDIFLSENEINFKQGDDLAFFTFSEKNISINVQNGFNHQNAGIELSEDHTKQLIEFINKPLQKQNQELLEVLNKVCDFTGELMHHTHDNTWADETWDKLAVTVDKTLAKWGGG